MDDTYNCGCRVPLWHRVLDRIIDREHAPVWLHNWWVGAYERIAARVCTNEGSE